jgi:acetolactate synthase-1/3 small subunit
MEIERTFSILVNDRPGVLTRIAGLFARRGFNISSITVGVAEEEGVSRMTIVSHGDQAMAMQVLTQVGKLVDVLDVIDMSQEKIVKRELALIKVKADRNNRQEISHILDPFRVLVVDVGHTSITVQITGDVEKIDALIGLLRPYGIVEISRTGVTALLRSGTEEANDAVV